MDYLRRDAGQAGVHLLTGGIRAAHGLCTLKLMGYDRVANYDGSMGEWANMEGMPLER